MEQLGLNVDGIIVVRGTVENIVYHSDDTGYGVFDIEDENGELVTVVGTVPFISVGEQVELYGKWTHHKVYGRQFKAERFEKILPTDKNDILRYLSSGAIKGIGPKTAKKIVDKYGEETFDVISNHPTWLADINGISLKKATEMSNDFKEKSGIREIIMYFKDSFSPNTAMKIYKRWGRNALGILKENPYCLCTDIEGIGFKRADEIAMEAGISKDNENRIKSGILYVLGVFAARDGHTFVCKDDLIDATSKLIDVVVDLVAPQIIALAIEKKIKIVEHFSKTHVYLIENYLNEEYIARKLIVLNRTVSSLDSSNARTLIGRIEAEDGITYAKMQKIAIEESLKNGVTVLTGGPGTGKTTIIKAVLQIFNMLQYKCALCAPTGRAAKKMSEATSTEAKTIHRLLEVDMGNEYSKGPTFMKNENNHLDQDVVIVDETSMIDVSLMSALLKAMKPGSRIILIGDIYQLPSVGEGNVLNDIINSGYFSVITLNEIFRQAENSGIVVNAHKINQGAVPDFKARYDDFFYVSITDETVIPEYIANMCKTRLPAKYGTNIVDGIQVISPTKKGFCGTQNLNAVLQLSLNPASDSREQYITRTQRIYRVGDKVMQTRNNYDVEWKRGSEVGRGIFNGDIGVIEEINNEEKLIIVNYDGKLASYDFSLLDEIEHAYAITVHKSQGSEYPIVIIPITKCAPILQTRNLIYTAITRAEKIVLLIGEKDILETMVGNNTQIFRNTGLIHFLKSNSI
ncbi:MAG: ATP-dependent RecD-like DNA helicase [Clostridia bacterium]|nr:ATP-dependent RecD-like DNA helicase [Clostridia bacterium]